MVQPRQADKDYATEAVKQGMSLSETSYSIAGRGLVYIATDRPQSSFNSVDAYIQYVYENRHDRDRVQFINIDKNNRYNSRSEQDLITRAIAEQEGVETVPPFRREAMRVEETERRETEIVRVSYAGSPVRIEVDVTDMRQVDRDSLRQDIERMGRRPDENALFSLVDRYFPYIDRITVRGREVEMGNSGSAMSDINSISGHV
ncbi:MAG: hypothetical protein PHQ80_01200 [Candidatus ainarchaeum sp.]|nr:hypothetical protein [Candidatus ainarchaeum sp.]MDD5095951.1 hypothetical protein [Candidatus ainarchaeum sp.]